MLDSRVHRDEVSSAWALLTSTLPWAIEKVVGLIESWIGLHDLRLFAPDTSELDLLGLTSGWIRASE